MEERIATLPARRCALRATLKRLARGPALLRAPIGRVTTRSGTPRAVGSRHAAHALRLLARGGGAGRADASRSPGDTTADVVIVGGGYLGLWTAWQLKELEPELDVVVLEAGLAGHGPSGRNGGFVSTLWDDLPILRDAVGDTRAVEVCRASERAVHGIGAWCEAQGVDAWYRSGGTLQVATSDAQLGDWDEVVEACGRWARRRRPSPLVARRGRRTLRLTALPRRHAPPHGRERAAGTALARAAGEGDRRPASASTSARPSARSSRDAVATTPQRHGARARPAVLAVNSATPGSRATGSRSRVASSHMVITEPVPDVIEEIGWTGGENIHDCRTLLHYFRTTNDGRIALGWGGGRMGVGGRHTRPPRHRRRTPHGTPRRRSAASSRSSRRGS